MNLPFLIVFGLALLVFFLRADLCAQPPFEGKLPSCLPKWRSLGIATQHRSVTRGLDHAGGSGKASGVSPRFAGPKRWILRFARRLARAGYRRAYHADILIGAKLILPAIAGLAVAAFVNQGVVFFFMVALAVGFFAPEFWLARAIRRRCEEIRLSLPDALDLLTICFIGWPALGPGHRESWFGAEDQPSGTE